MMVEEYATIRYRITPSQEPVPNEGDILHARGFTNWHVVVLKRVETFPPNEDGTQDVKMRVRRTAIGKQDRSCPACGATWMANGAKG